MAQWLPLLPRALLRQKVPALQPRSLLLPGLAWRRVVALGVAAVVERGWADPEPGQSPPLVRKALALLVGLLRLAVVGPGTAHWLMLKLERHCCRSLG